MLSSIYRPVIYRITEEPRWWLVRIISTLNTIISSFPIKLWQVPFAKHRAWLAEVYWAAWTTRATFDSRLQRHGWCRYRTLSVNKRCFPCIMETRYSFLTWRTSSRVSRGWMLHDTYTVDTPDSLNESAPAERQGCSHENVWLHKIDRQLLDGLPLWLNDQEGTLLFPWLDGSSGYQPQLCMSQQGNLWPVSIGESIPVQNCNHEKGDMRIVVHVLHALKQGKQTIYMHTVDTDVVIVAGMLWCNSTCWRHLSGLWHEQGW